MKFGKRFSQAQGGTSAEYLSYKALKQALKSDCINCDALGTRFEQTLAQELDKVSKFYRTQEAQLQDTLTQLQCEPVGSIAPGLAALRLRLQNLTKYAALNYVAVLKAVKKRNRRLRDACGDQVVTVAPLSVLQHETFFTSRELLRISAAALALDPTSAQREAPNGAPDGCPLCRQLAQAPVKLSCAHEFCWGCITMYCLGVLHTSLNDPSHAGKASPGYHSSPSGSAVAPASMSQLTQGWAPSSSGAIQTTQVACPVCHREQDLDLDALTVDATLAGFVQPKAHSATQYGACTVAAAGSGALSSPRSLSARSDDDSTASGSVLPVPLAPKLSHQKADDIERAAAMLSAESNDTAQAWQEALLPPQQACWRGKLSIVLDIDGTLIASFPPRRAPKLPSHMKAHLVGAGSALNPQGVFVVERPGLSEFLRRVSAFGELSVFTAGLPEYARPILAAIDPGGTYFGDRVVCRAGTCIAPEYPCVKDLSRLGRDGARTLIVDDTPLAFLWQPGNGVPVLGFRGDPDDNLLLDAVLPLLQLAAAEGDVRPFLDRRFGMAAWFTSHGYVTHPPDHTASSSSLIAVPGERQPAGATDAARSALEESLAARAPRGMPQHGPLLLCDFDKTLVDFDVTERLVARLAADLVSEVANAPSGDFVFLMASLISDLAQRGVTLAALQSALRELGREVAAPVAQLLRAARADGIASCVLSNCNTLFISEVLKGAGLGGVVHDVIAHPASGDTEGAALSAVVVDPLQAGRMAPDCPLCPAHMCKGMHVQALRKHHSRTVFCCDGANDLCGVLCLQEGDVALVREGYACHAALRDWQAGTHSRQPVCQVLYWSTPHRLAALARRELGI